MEMGLPIPLDFKQNHGMEDMQDKAQTNTLQGFVKWATTLPQSIAVYFICVVLIGGFSFYVGTLKPKKTISVNPPPVSAPRN
jgi:hypothetical protein